MKKIVATGIALCSVIVGGELLPAFAGYWEEVPNPYDNNWGSTNWKTEANERWVGKINYDQHVPVTTRRQAELDWVGDLFQLSGVTNIPYPSGDNIVRGYKHVIKNESIGKIRSKFKWHPDIDWETGLPDENDTPPSELILVIQAGGWALAGSDVSDNLRNTSKEHVSVSAFGEQSKPEDNEDIFSDGWQTGASLNLKKLYRIPTYGQTEVWGPWVYLSAKANVDGERVIVHDDGNGSWEEPLEGYTSLAINYDAQIDERKVKITSPTIEASYGKENTWLNTNPTANVYREDTPEPPAEGPYSIRHERGENDSISTTSVVYWGNTFVDARPVNPLPPGYCWMFRGNFVADINQAWTNPTFTWGYTGDGAALPASLYAESGYSPDRIVPASDSRYGGLLQGDDKAHLVVDFHATSNGDYSNAVNFIGPPLADIGSNFPKQGRVKLDVSDTDGATANRTFDITWHLPVENWQPDSNNPPTPAPNELFPDPGKTSLNNSVGGPNDAFFFQMPPLKVEADTETNPQIVSAALSWGSASVPIIGHLTGASALTGPYGWGVASLMALGANVASLSADPEPEPMQSESVTANYAEFKSAIELQIAINADPELYEDNLPRVNASPATLLAIKDQFKADNQWELDPYFNPQSQLTPTTVIAVAGRYRFHNYFLGDKYDLNGYVGQIPGHLITSNGAKFHVFTWTVTAEPED